MTHGLEWLHAHTCPFISLICSDETYSIGISILNVVHKSYECIMSSEERVSSGFHTSIGLLTYGSILICSPKNRLRLLDTFFRNPCILVPDTETQSSVNGVAQAYIRERDRGLWHSLESALVFTRLNAAQRWVGCAPPLRPHWRSDCSGRTGIQTSRLPWTNCREKWNQHSKNNYTEPQDDLISAQRKSHLIFFLLLRSNFVDDNCAYLQDEREREKITSLSYRHDLTSLRFLSCDVYLWQWLMLLRFGHLSGSIFYLVP